MNFQAAGTSRIGRDGSGVKDRNPAQADAFGARREPDRVHGRDRRILDHLRHGVAAEAVPPRGGRIGEHREMAGRIIEAGELEPGIGRPRVLRSAPPAPWRCTFRSSREWPHGTPVCRRDKSPWLAQPHRRRQAGQTDEPLQCSGRERVAPEAPDVATPREQFAQAAAKGVVEFAAACPNPTVLSIGAVMRRLSPSPTGW